MPPRKPVKPIKEPTASEAARHTNTLLEELHGEFKAFGEGLSDVRTRVERLEPTVNQLATEFQTFKTALFEVSRDVKTLKKDVAELKTDVREVKDRLTTAEAKLSA